MQILNSVSNFFTNPQTGSEANKSINWKRVATIAAVVAVIAISHMNSSAPIEHNSGKEITSLVTSLPVSDRSVLNFRNATGICPSNTLSKEVAPYANALLNRVQPEAAGIVQKFPNWLPRFHANGLFASSDGTRYCQYKVLIPSSETCDQVAKLYEQLVSKEVPSIYRQLISIPVAQRGDGGYARIENDAIPLVRFVANPARVTNQRVVQSYLEKTVLKSPMKFFNRSYEEILNCFHRMHELFWNNVQNNFSVEANPGRFRTEAGFVTEEKGDAGIFGGLRNILQKKGGSIRDAQLLEKIIKKMSTYPIREAFEKFTKAEMSVFRKIAFIPPLPELVPEKMKKFILKLKEIGPQVVRGELDGLAAASWFHQQFGNIHPYDDHNGHIARSFSNTLMQLGGYHAVAFPDDDLYTAAVGKDQSYPGLFARYLENVQLWNQERRDLNL